MEYGARSSYFTYLLQLLFFNNFGVRLHFKAYCLSLECNAVAVEHIRQQSLPQASVPMGRAGKPVWGHYLPCCSAGRGEPGAQLPHTPGLRGLGRHPGRTPRGSVTPRLKAAGPSRPRPAPLGPARPRLRGRSRCGSATSRRPPRPYSCVWERRLETKLLTRFI